MAILPASMTTAGTGNHLLDALPETDREAVLERAWFRDVEPEQELIGNGGRIDTVWFPVNAVVSLLATLRDGSGIETATVGREGVVGAVVFLGDDRLRNGRAVVQLAGEVIGVPTDAFRAAAVAGTTLHTTMNHYTRALVFQLSQGVACNGAHSVRERLARWLLHTTDRVGREEVELTQQFLSEILHARRASVTDALASLESTGAVRRSRGRIEILARPALEAAACECYAHVRAAYTAVAV
jgi:CRP-like cAMP-binding protein